MDTLVLRDLIELYYHSLWKVWEVRGQFFKLMQQL